MAGTIFRETNFKREVDAGLDTPVAGGPKIAPKIGQRVAPAGSAEAAAEAAIEAKKKQGPPAAMLQKRGLGMVKP